jgi:predicted nuclease of predicted toxin-antitoxin system
MAADKRPKLLADPLFPEGVVEDLKQTGYDAVHAGEIGAADLPLTELARLAVFENRILLSSNRAMARLIESSLDPRPSLVFFRELKGGADAWSHVLVNLLTLFDEDLADGALIVIRNSQTLLRKFSHPRD